MRKLLKYIKKEVVLFISLLLALASMAFVPPDNHYFSYIDFHTLTIMLGLMIIMAGLRSLGIFSMVGKWMLEKTSNVRSLAIVLVMLCFVFSIY
jgi:Na+/H+ antiporter NhaD/arsenite permease-like protein